LKTTVQPAPPGAALLWRLLGELFLCVLWIRGPDRPLGLIVILFLCIMSLARWRFPLPAWTVLLDQAACAAFLQYWPDASFGLALPVFDAMFAAGPWFALPVIGVMIGWHLWGLALAAALCLSAGAGMTVLLWARAVERLRREADADRREKYELARLKDDLLVANLQTARTAELAERARIARDLHDHLGHELTAADLALRAFGQLWKDGDAQAPELLAQAGRRIAEGIGVLRATVAGMSLGREPGVGGLEEICRTLCDPPPALAVHGNADLVQPHSWSVLEPCLKEGLTNAVRHGTPGTVSVSLDIGPRIVRLCVHNTPGSGGRTGPQTLGKTPRAPGEAGGVGLRSLRQRARAVGGSLTTDTTDGFRLICVLPLYGPHAGPRLSSGTAREPGGRQDAQ
jgi:two-component system, NarL family, sensor histidine kinase DesK